MGYKDRLKQTINQAQEDSYKARVAGAVSSAQTGADKIRQLAEAAAQAQARTAAHTVGGVTPTATRTAAAPGSMSASEFLRQMASAATSQARAQQAAAIAPTQATPAATGVRYNLATATHGQGVTGAARQAAGLIAPKPDSLTRAYGESQGMMARRLANGWNDFTSRNNLADYARNDVKIRAQEALGELTNYENAHPTMTPEESAYHEALRDAYEYWINQVVTTRDQAYTQAANTARNRATEAPEYMARYYANLPNYADFWTRQENAYTRPTAEEMAKYDLMGNSWPQEAINRSNMTDEELATATYLRNTQGEAAAQAYLSTLETTLNARQMEKARTNAQNFAEEHPVAGAMLARAANPLSGIASTTYMAGQAAKALGSHIANSWLGLKNVQRQPFTVDYNSPMLGAGVFRETLDTSVGQQIQSAVDDKTGAIGQRLGLGELANKVYQATMSGVLDSAIRNATLGGVGELTMSMDSMISGMREVKERGGNILQQLAVGGVNGLMEALTEHMKSEDIARLFIGGKENALREIGRSMLSEGIEEMTSDTADKLADFFVMGDRSDFEEKKRGYMDEGLSEQEATRRALLDMAIEVGESGLGGAWGGLWLGGGSSAIGSVSRFFSNSAEVAAQNQINKMSRTYDKQTGEIFKNSWDGETTPDEYKTVFDALFGSGRMGLSLEQTTEAAAELLGEMKPSRQYQIWQAGQNAGRDVISGRPTGETGQIETDNTIEARREMQSLSQGYDGKTARVFMQNYDYSNAPADYKAAFDTLRGADEAGMEAIREEAHNARGLLSEKQVTSIWQGLRQRQTAQNETTGAGNNKNAAERSVERDAEIETMPDVSGRTEAERFNPQTVKGGAVKNYTARRLNYRQGVNIRALDRLGKRLGIEFEIVDSIKGGRANAAYAGGRRFLVALDATESAYLQAGAHELVHYVKDFDADGYRAMERLVLDALGRDETFDIEARISARQEEYANAGQQLTRDQALEEIVAEAVPTVFTDQQVIERLVMEDRTLAEKIGDWMHKFVEMVTKALRESAADYAVSQGREEIASLYNQAEALREIAKAFDSALERAGENAAARETQEQSQSVEATEETQAASLKGEERQSLKNQSRFSMKAPVERKGNLFAVHNLNSDVVPELLRLGGMPMPSVAIVSDKMGHEGYGDVSVVLRPEAIDPQANKRNKVYGQDAWTPRFPHVDWEINSRAAQKTYNKLSDLYQDVEGEFKGWLSSFMYQFQKADTSDSLESAIEKAMRNDGVKAAYLEDTGRHVEILTKQEPVDKKYHADRTEEYERILAGMGEDAERINAIPVREIRDKYGDLFESVRPGSTKSPMRFAGIISQLVYYQEDKARGFKGTYNTVNDYPGTKRAMDEQIDEAAFEKWVRGLYDGVYGEAGIQNGKEMYTPSGNVRSFKQLHDAYTLSNIVKAMTSAGSKNAEGGFHGATGLMAAASREFKTLDEVREASGQLRQLPPGEYTARIADLDGRIFQSIRDIQQETGTSYDLDGVGEVMQDAARGAHTEAAIKKVFAGDGMNISDETARGLIRLFKDARDMPTGYFEAKPERAVSLEEIAAVIVPNGDDYSELVSTLKRVGLKVKTYEKGVLNSRLKALNSVNEARFALKNTSDTPVETERVLEGIDGRPAIRIYGTGATASGADAAQIAQERQEARQRFEGQKAAQTENRVTREAAQAEKAALQTAKQILKEYESKYDRNAMRDNMLALTEEIARNGASDDTLREATQLARAIIEQSSHVDTGLRDQYKDLRKELRETPVTLTETQKAEAANIAGSYGAFRKSVFGTFNLATEGKSLDAIWDEWSGKAPDLFTPQMNEGDMVQRLVDIRAAFMPTVSNPYGEDMDGASVDLGLRLQESALKALGDDAGARDMAEAITELRRQYQDAMREERLRVKAQQRAAFDQIAAALRDARNSNDDAAKDAAMAAYRGQMKRIGAEAAEAQARLAYRLRFEDRAERAKTWERITKYATDMRNTLAKPNKKKHVPQELQQELLTMLGGLDFTRNGRESEGNRQWRESLTRIDQFLSEQMLRQQTPEGDTRGIWMSICQPALDLFHNNVEVVLNARGPINQMTLNEMKNLSSALAQVNHAINSINEMWTNARHETVDEVAGRTMDELDMVRTNRAQNSAAPIRMLDTMLNVENLDAGSFFQRLGKAATTVYDGLREGQSKAYARIREASEAAKSIFTNSKKERRQWAKEQHDVGVSYGAELRTVKMTGTQLMELYALSRREQGRKHLLTGGFRLDGEGGKLGDTRTYKMTEDQLNAAVSQLSRDQKATTERMQDYLSHTVSEWGNEVTERMYLYRLFGEDTYWPIRSEKGFMRTREQDGTMLFNALTNAGFTKNVQDMVSNPLMIGDAIETFSGHVSDMATFSGLAMPVDDLLRWYNYAARDENGRVAYTTSVKKEVERTTGRGGLKYIQNLLDDLNGMGKSAQESAFVSWMMSSYKRAAIMAKLRVVIQQPTAILRASAEINPVYLTEALATVGGHNIQEMQEHSALAWWKSNGNYEIGTGASMKSIITGMQDSAKDDVFEALNSPAGAADDLGWRAIWIAVKRETAAKHKDLEVGSEAYWEHVANRFEDICMRTQVVDTVLTRSAMMRSKSAFQKMATAFMSEPTKNFNLMRTGISEFYGALQSGNAAARHRAEGKILRSGAAIAAATALNAVMTAAFDAFKYYDPDKKDEEGEAVTRLDEFLDNWLEDFADGMNPLTSIPYVKDVYAVLQGDDVERMDLSSISRLVNAVNRADKYFRQGNPNAYTTWAAVKPLVTGIGDILGLPVSGLVADTELALNIIRPGSVKTKMKSATSAGAFEELYDAMAAGDTAKAGKLRAEMAKGQAGRAAKTDKAIDEGVADMLAVKDDRIRQYWEQRESGKTSGLLALKKEIMASGFTEEQVIRAVNRYPNIISSEAKGFYLSALEEGDAEKAETYAAKLRGVGVTDEDMAKWTAEKEEVLELKNVYTTANLFASIRSAETTDADIMDIRDYLISASGAEDPEKSVASSVSGEFKEEYIKLMDDGKAAEADRLKARLMAVGVKEKTIDGWVYKKDDLYDMIRGGGSGADIAELTGHLAAMSTAADPAKSVASGVASELKEEYLAALNAGRTKEADTLKRGMMSAGVKEDTIDAWAPAKEKADATDALKAAIDKGDARAAERETERIRDEEIMDVSSLVSRLNSAYKQKWFDLMDAGKEREADALADMLAGLGLKKKNGENYYSGAWWNEEYRKHLKEMEE